MTEEHFGLSGTASALPSERDQNFLLRTESGKKFVIKIANPAEDPAFLEFQNRIMEDLGQENNPLPCPRPFAGAGGNKIFPVRDPQGNLCQLRLLTFLEGVPLGNYIPHTSDLLEELGSFAARLSRAFAALPQRRVQPDFLWNLKNGPTVLEKFCPRIADPEKRNLLDFFRGWLGRQSALFSGLAEGLVFNDGNDFNILIDPQAALSGSPSVAGLIDFGDITYSYTLSDLAVVLAYALMGKRDPLGAACSIVRGYHRLQPLTESEQAALWPLACLRLCMSVAIAAGQKALVAGNPYLSISEEPAWRLLETLREIPPVLAHFTIRQACGLIPVPEEERTVSWLKKSRSAFHPVFGFPLNRETATVLDSGVASPLFEKEEDWQESEALIRILHGEIARSGRQIGIGRYRESRLLRLPSLGGPGRDRSAEGRSVHLGLDLFAPAGTAVHAPLAGRVHSFRDNRSDRDYGPTLILEHRPEPDLHFFTLYGHLSRESLERQVPGKSYAAGEPLAVLGDPSVNGGWAPHLHFQIIIDLLGMEGDFPGAAAASHEDVWTSLSPDPNLLLGLPDELVERRCLAPGLLLEKRKTCIGKSLRLSYRAPRQMVRGYRQHLYDVAGRRYLDAVNNVPHVGHCHPRVVEAVRRQLTVLHTNTRYLHDHLVQYAQQLWEHLPEPLRVCFFVNSGSEANDLALRLARNYTGARDVLVLDSAYHGNLSSLIDISPYKFNGPGGTGCPPHTHVLPRPDPYRGRYRGADTGLLYASHIPPLLDEIRSHGGRAAAFIAESLPGCGGQIVPPDGYLQEAFRLARNGGLLCIADEVQVGFGRCGTHFWAFEAQGAVPDILTLGKPIGNGHPLGAVITSRAIADAFDNGMEYFNTYGGNPVSCAAGMAVLEVLAEEKLPENARETGAFLREGMGRLQERFPLLGDIRGLGLFLGVELVLDRRERVPAPSQAAYVAERMCQEGVLISTDGPDHNVLKIKPPMVFTRNDAALLLERLEAVLQETPLQG